MAPDEIVDRSSIRTMTRAVTGLLGVEVLVLAATGTALLFDYRPEPVTSLSGFGGPGPSPAVLSTRGLHIWTSRLMILTVVIAAVMWTVTAAVEARPGRWKAPLWCGALAGGVFATTFTGLLLPWNNLALRAVTASTDVRGYGFVLPGSKLRVLFVLIDNVETSLATVRWELGAHMLTALFVILLMIAAGLRIQQQRTRHAPPPPSTQELDALV